MIPATLADAKTTAAPPQPRRRPRGASSRRRVAVLDLSFDAEMDLGSFQYCGMTFGATRETVKPCGLADVPLGILQNRPAAGEKARVRVFGPTKVKVCAAVPADFPLAVGSERGELFGAVDCPDLILCTSLEACNADGLCQAAVTRYFVADRLCPSALTAALRGFCRRYRSERPCPTGCRSSSVRWIGGR
jgi:hypothetical protein